MIPKRLLKSALLIRRVARVNSGGKVRTVSALVAVGNGNGMLGIGMGRGKDGQTAVRKAAIKAESEMVSIPRLDQRTIYHDINFKYHSVKLLMRVAKPGHGLVTNHLIHEMCRCAGISDLVAKLHGSRNPLNVVKATFEALKQQKLPIDIARIRGKKIYDVEKTYYGTVLRK